MNAAKDFPGRFSREQLGQLVRAEWIEWAKEQEKPKPNWLTPWDELDESMKEVDRRIGQKVASVCNVSPDLLVVEDERDAARDALRELMYVSSHISTVWTKPENKERADAAYKKAREVLRDE